MDVKRTAVTIIGVILALLGTLWFVQGLGVVQVGPVLCVADCEPVTGGSARWTVIGAITSILGIGAVWVGLGRFGE